MVVQTPDGTLSVRRKETPGPYFDTGNQVSWGWQDYLGQPGQGLLYFADITGDNRADLIVHETNGDISVRKNMGTYFDAGREASVHWSNFLGGEGKGLLYFG